MNTKETLLRCQKALGRTNEQTREFLCVPKGTWNSWMSGKNEGQEYILQGFQARIEQYITNDVMYWIERTKSEGIERKKILYGEEDYLD